MSKYLNLFKTKAEADAAVYDENNTPNVSYCEEDESVKYTEKILPPPAWMEMVDLGLPSGTLWAKANIGAETETDSGKYFQWGDVEGRTVDEIASKPCNWSTTPFNNGSKYDGYYFNTHKSEWLDGDVLKPQYDAASVNIGDNWRMPTKADCDELLANTTNEWVEVNGVNGRRFTGTNGNSIFIPAAG